MSMSDHISINSNRTQVILFGTSADPPTGEGGHVGIAKALSALPEFHQIRILPVYRHNFVTKRDRLLPFGDRMNMCALAFEGIPRVVVSDSELICFQEMAKGKTDEEIQEIKIGTADLLEMLLKNEADSDFTFALGGDTFMDLTNFKWQRSREVLKILNGRFVVIFREGNIPEDVLLERIEKLNRDEGGQARLLKIPYLHDVSSTAIRSTSEVKDLENLVTPQVLNYILMNKLYGFADQKI